LRYIFLAAACTLGVIAGLLALPSIGEPHAQLVEQSVGDRLAQVAQLDTETESGSRQLSSPAVTTTTIDVEVGAAVETTEAETTTTSTSTTTTTTTTAAPTTTTSTTTTTTTAAPTTTTTSAAELANDTGDGGVLITSTGVVLPVIGRSSAGWRAMTPCGVEVTLDEGTRVAQTDIVIDPGHGGSEPGAVGPNGATEKALNLRIAEIVKWFLERDGYDVVLTRTTDIRIPLRSRAEIANALDADAFISIHHNGGATRRQDTPGSEIFVDGGNPEASRLGGIIFEEMMDAMDDFDAEWVGSIRNGVQTRFNDEGDDLYGIHRYTPGVPSVITEVGYLSNPTEAALFVDNDVQWAHGRAIAEGIARWTNTSDAGSGFNPDFVDAGSSGTGGFDGCTDPALQ
jgi:N-acetylmuramoyl-L-alanine amidase